MLMSHEGLLRKLCLGYFEILDSAFLSMTWSSLSVWNLKYHRYSYGYPPLETSGDGYSPHKKDQKHQEWRKGPGVSADQRWNFWPALPIAPYERRLTKRYEVVPGSG